MALVKARPEAEKRLYGFDPCRTEAEKRIMASVGTRRQKSSPFGLVPICLDSKTEAE